MKYTTLLLLTCLTFIVFSFSLAAQPVKVSSDSVSPALFQLGSMAFMQNDYSHAIMYYQKLFDREKDSPSLVKIYWYVLIDNLGMAYGISKKLDAAENIFKYGVSKDPTYPLFYYNLACTYAEREDMDRAIEYLRTAYKCKNNLIPGETIPDPMSDDSFQRFAGNKIFVDAVKEMEQK